MAVPKIIHQGWCGPKPMPQELVGYCAEMKRMNPDFEQRLFGNEILGVYGSDAYVRNMISIDTPWAFVVDRIRLLLLRDHGGIWIDPDAKPIKPLSSLGIWERADLDFCHGTRNPKRTGVALSRGIPFFDNTVMASAKNGRIVNLMLSGYSSSKPILNGSDACKIAASEAGLDTLTLGYKYFYGMEVHPGSVVLHDPHNLASWCKHTPLKFATA